VAEYRTLFNQVHPAINAAILVGHNTLHAGVCGYEARTASPDELKRMTRKLEQALEEGAIGLSSGLAYPPGSAVEREELIALCKVVAQQNGVYATHMRSESAGLLEAIDEAIEIAEKGGVRLQISHLKASGESNWNKLSVALKKIHAAQTRLDIGADRYPYTAGSTDLDILLPQWASYGGRAAVLERIRTPKIRSKILKELSMHPRKYWENVMIGSCGTEAFRGRFLPDIARELETSEAETFLHLIDADELATGGIFFSMSEENLKTVLAEPYVSIGSDGSMRATRGPLSVDHPHPRSYGSHSHFLEMARDEKTVPLAEAIRKMTTLPAKQYGLKHRGEIRVGYFADIAIFKLKEVKEKTTYAQPHQLSEGLIHLFVNGVHTVNKKKTTSCHAGRFLAG
jgi:N-acyl-D-amino-acid deacylase